MSTDKSPSSAAIATESVHSISDKQVPQGQTVQGGGGTTGADLAMDNNIQSVYDIRKTQPASASGTDEPAESPPPTVAPVLMKSSNDSLRFLQQIVDDDLQSILFEDSLVTVSDTGREVGEFKVVVSMAMHRGQAALLVHANSHGTVDGVACGTSIVTYVSPERLVTLEQQHHEYVKLANHPLDRKTFTVKEKEGYRVDRTITQGTDVQESTKMLDIPNTEAFITEGSNLLLQRLLIRRGMPEDMRVLCLDTDLNICQLTYVALESHKQVISETEVEMTGIERKIISPSDLPTCWQSYFLKDGHLTSRVQVGSPVMMRLLQLPASVDEEEKYVRPTFDKKSIDWEEDDQMHSKYLDRKEELRSDHATYMRAHPELRALLDDYMQFLLLRKPADTIAFAADYFSAFSARMPGTQAYKSSAHETLYPLSGTNSKIKFFSCTH